VAVSFPPQELDCPDPAGCPVLATLPELNTVELSSGRALFRVYDSRWGHDEHNPGFGDARFSPFDDPQTGVRVPTMYLADDPRSALLETVFHEVHHAASRTVYEAALVGKLLAYLRVPESALLGDLRDDELRRLGLAREQVVSSVAEHYPCTRRLAVQAVAEKG
jgi:RES domain-containing protein